MRQRINPAPRHTGLASSPKIPQTAAMSKLRCPRQILNIRGFSAFLYRMTYFAKCCSNIRFGRSSPRHVQPATETIMQKIQLKGVPASVLRADEDAYFGLKTIPPRQNSCRLDKILNSGAMMRERRGAIRTGIQG